MEPAAEQPDERDPASSESLPDDADQSITLEQLSAAFAQMLGDGGESTDPAADGDAPATTEEAAETATESAADGDACCPTTPLSIVEAMLFVGTPDNRPLTSTELAALMRGVSPQEVDELVQQLNRAYEEEQTAYFIASEGPGYRMILRPEMNRLRNKFYGRVKEARLSQAAIDVLAIVAYNQPLTRAEVDKLRDRPSGAILTQLVRRQLLGVQRNDQKPRVLRYSTTDRFLALFGLGSLDDLPRSQELDRTP